MVYKQFTVSDLVVWPNPDQDIRILHGNTIKNYEYFGMSACTT